MRKFVVCDVGIDIRQYPNKSKKENKNRTKPSERNTNRNKSTQKSMSSIAVFERKFHAIWGTKTEFCVLRQLTPFQWWFCGFVRIYKLLSSYRAKSFTLKQVTEKEVLPLEKSIALCNFCFLFFLFLLMTRVKRIRCPGRISCWTKDLSWEEENESKEKRRRERWTGRQWFLSCHVMLSI